MEWRMRLNSELRVKLFEGPWVGVKIEFTVIGGELQKKMALAAEEEEDFGNTVANTNSS